MPSVRTPLCEGLRWRVRTPGTQQQSIISLIKMHLRLRFRLRLPMCLDSSWLVMFRRRRVAHVAARGIIHPTQMDHWPTDCSLNRTNCSPPLPVLTTEVTRKTPRKRTVSLSRLGRQTFHEHCHDTTIFVRHHSTLSCRLLPITRQTLDQALWSKPLPISDFRNNMSSDIRNTIVGSTFPIICHQTSMLHLRTPAGVSGQLCDRCLSQCGRRNKRCLTSLPN